MTEFDYSEIQEEIKEIFKDIESIPDVANMLEDNSTSDFSVQYIEIKRKYLQ